MFNLKFFPLYLLSLLTAVIGISCTLQELNAKIQAEAAQTEESGTIVKTLEKLNAPYDDVHTMDLTVQIDTKHSKSNFYLMDHLNFALKNLKVNYAHIISVNTPKPKREILNVWVVDSYKNFVKIHLHAETNTRNKAGIYFIVLYQWKQNPSHLLRVQRIFRQMFKINVLNVLVMFKIRGQPPIIYGYNPFSSDYCRKIKPFVVRQFHNKSLINNNIWPNNINNFHKCSIKLYTWNILPFMTFDHTGKDNLNLNGIEGTILRSIAKRLNFTIHLRTDNALYYGDIDENGVATGPFFLLQKGFVDVLMGSFFSSATRSRFLSETRTYLSTKLVAVVRKISCSTYYDDWIFDPFTKSAWFFIVIYFVKVLGLILLLTPRTERSNILFNIIATCLGVSQRLSDTRKKCCFAIMLWTFGFLIIRNAYQAKIYDAYRVARTYKPPETLDELVAQNYKIYSSRIYNDSTSNIGIPTIGLENGRLVLELLEHDVEYHSAGILSYARLLFYILRQKKHGIYDVVNQPLYMQQLCAYFRQHSYLTRPFDMLIAQMQTSGLLQKWSTDKHNKGWDMPFSMTEIRVNVPQPMTIYKFKKLFYILLFMHILSICIFLLEIWGMRKLKKILLKI